MKLISKIFRMIDEVSFVFYDEPNARGKNGNQRNTDKKERDFTKEFSNAFKHITNLGKRKQMRVLYKRK